MHENTKLIRSLDDLSLYNRFITSTFTILGEVDKDNLSDTDMRDFCGYLARINEVAGEETEGLLFEADRDQPMVPATMKDVTAMFVGGSDEQERVSGQVH